MSRPIDYSKWSSIEDESDDEQSSSVSQSLSSNEKLGGLKLSADKLFAAAECSRSPYDYKVALNQGYRIVLCELERLFGRNGPLTEELLLFEMSCMLNSSCCHLKLMELNETIIICTEIFLKYSSFMSDIQILRSRYFRSYAYYRLGNDNFAKAESDAACMRDILVSLPQIDAQSAAEYANYFEVLVLERKKRQLLDDAIRSESEYQKNDRDSKRTKEGWNLYIQKDFRSSAIWFASKLKGMKETCKDTQTNESDVLCDLFCGYGKSQSALKNYGEAAKAFLASASHATSSTAKSSLHLRAASLHCKTRAYEDAIQSYATAIVLCEDDCNEDTITATSGLHGPDGNTVAEYDRLLFIAIANSGLGLCYLKIQEHTRAVEHLKAAIGYMTDDMFTRRVITPRRKVPFMQSPEVANSETDTSTSVGAGFEQRALTLATATTEANHLLNALESLSDAYAAMREWEKAMYTANCSLEVCQSLLDVIRPENILRTIGLNEEGTPIGAVEQETKISSLSIEIKERFAMALRVRCTVSLIESDADDQQAERELHVKAICRKRAYSLLAKGHMMKKILHHDINRTDDSGEAVEGYTFAGLDKNLSNEPLHCPSPTSSTTLDTGVSAVEAIAALWNDSAAEFDRLGDLKEAFKVYKDVAALWGSLAAFEPYSDSLFLLERYTLRNEDTSARVPTLLDSSTSSSAQCRDIDVSCGGSNRESGLQNALPIQPTSTENIRRIDAALKAKDAWVVAADNARKLCKQAPDEALDMKEEEAESQNNKIDRTDVERLDLEMTSWREVIQCQYYAGLCAMLHGMSAAEELFEKAQDTRGIYQDIAGALLEAEKKEGIKDTAILKDADTSSNTAQQSNPSCAVIMTDKMLKRKELSKQSWLSYNTLCCDISYHLSYTYLRAERVAYAIAEAEMAIGFATRSTDSKVRRRKCWGILALGFHASGQAQETVRALNEVEQLRLGNRTIGSEDADDEYIKRLHLFMEHNAPKKLKKSLTDAVRHSDSVDDKSIESAQAACKTSKSFFTLLDMKRFDRKFELFLYLGSTSFIVLIFSIFIYLMLSQF